MEQCHAGCPINMYMYMYMFRKHIAHEIQSWTCTCRPGRGPTPRPGRTILINEMANRQTTALTATYMMYNKLRHIFRVHVSCFSNSQQAFTQEGMVTSLWSSNSFKTVPDGPHGAWGSDLSCYLAEPLWILHLVVVPRVYNRGGGYNSC